MPENNNSSNQSLLPYNLDAEQSVLGSILIEPDCMELIIDKIKAEYFYLPQNQKIFSSIGNYVCRLKRQRLILLLLLICL